MFGILDTVLTGFPIGDWIRQGWGEAVHVISEAQASQAWKLAYSGVNSDLPQY
jgi:hypothetical protein